MLIASQHANPTMLEHLACDKTSRYPIRGKRGCVFINLLAAASATPMVLHSPGLHCITLPIRYIASRQRENNMLVCLTLVVCN
jgi:hypothetical protein